MGCNKISMCNFIRAGGDLVRRGTCSHWGIARDRLQGCLACMAFRDLSTVVASIRAGIRTYIYLCRRYNSEPVPLQHGMSLFSFLYPHQAAALMASPSRQFGGHHLHQGLSTNAESPPELTLISRPHDHSPRLSAHDHDPLAGESWIYVIVSIHPFGEISSLDSPPCRSHIAPYP
jgi:hypothetical protein